MAEPQNHLRVTDFLPARFQGDTIDADLARAHFLAFTDYLEAHELNGPDEPGEIQDLTQIFIRTLKGQARLWIEGRQFGDLNALRDQFLARFSPSTSYIARSQAFRDLVYVPGKTAEVFLAKISKAALPLGYGDGQVRDKFLSSLPAQCKSAVLMSSPIDAPLADLVTKVQYYFDLNPIESQISLEDIAMAKQASDLPDITTPSSEEIKELCGRIETMETKFNKESVERSTRPSGRTDTQDLRHRYHSSDGRAFQSPGNFQRPRKPLICYRCRSPGHIARFCRLNMPQFAQQNARFPPNVQNVRFPAPPSWPQQNFPNMDSRVQNQNVFPQNASGVQHQDFP